MFNDSKNSLAFGAGIPVVFFFMNMISGMGEELSWIGSITPYGLFNAGEILTNGYNVLSVNIVLILITIVLYTAGILVFKRKNLPL